MSVHVCEMSQFELLTVAFALVSLSIGSAFTTLFFTCSVINDCVETGECTRVSLESGKYLPQCSASRSPTFADAYLPDGSGGGGGGGEGNDNNGSHYSIDDLQVALQAYCAPGERLQDYNGVSTSCVQDYTFPNSLNPRIGKPSAPTYSTRQCGAWMDAGGTGGDAYSALYYHDGIEQEVDAVLQAGFASITSSLSRTNIGKLAEKCESTLLAGPSAVSQSTKSAYAHLAYVSKLDEIASSDAALESLGVLGSHFCDTAVSIGYDYASVQTETSLAFVRVMKDGKDFDDSEFATSLFHVGASSIEIDDAVEALQRVRALAGSGTYSGSDHYPSKQVFDKVYSGAIGMGALPANLDLESEPAYQLAGFHKLAEEEEEEGASSPPSFRLTRAYLRGVSAMCSLDVTALISSTSSSSSSSSSAVDQVTALGRVLRRGDSSKFEEMDKGTVWKATSATFSKLSVRTSEHPGVVLSTQEDVTCASVAYALFPDSLDAELFSVVYSPKLYNMIHDSVLPRVRQGVAHALRTVPAIRNTLAEPDKIATDVERTRVRIPGAPRGTWAAASRTLPSAAFDSSDSVLQMVLKQGRAFFLDRQRDLVLYETDVCEGPPLMDSLQANAYIMPSVLCSYYLLGMSLRPFADDSYDTQSLLGGMGYVLAHELAHTTLNTGWYTSSIQSLLHRYNPDTHSEALADVVAGVGIVESNAFHPASDRINATRLCEHVAQVWCARTGSLYYSSQRGVHPMANQRGDYFCETMLVDLAYA